ncbi:MAG: hypothetical protein GWP08_11370 [Nitrospiraceae bacterium]|nr:hypothetical protein [Nitrospiraceae bacterium]
MSTQQHKFSHEAMAAPFEIIIAGQDESYARQTAMEAFGEVDALEANLSRYRDSSDISRINHLEPGVWIRVSLDTFDCLRAAVKVSAETGGAFDVTIGPLLACYRGPDRSFREPSPEELEAARACVGAHLLEFDQTQCAVRVKTKGVQVDLGGIGKGFAADCVAATLKEWDIDAALINAGESTVYALGHPPDADGWPLGVGGVGNEAAPNETIAFADRALSGSGTHVRGRHIMDPRTGRPADRKLATWAICPDATTADALSTAFMVMGVDEVEQYCAAHPGTAAMLALDEPGGVGRIRFGAW